VIVLEELYREYRLPNGEIVNALQEINYTVKKGEVVLLTGENGSGKSTLLSIMAGIIRPTSGRVIVCGEEIPKLPDHYSAKLRREKIGLIFQDFNLMDELTVSENVMLPLVPGELNGSEAARRVEDSINLMDLTHLKNRLSRNLSGGEKQRTAIARALVNKPELVLADEPTSQIDKAQKDAFVSYCEKLKDMGYTIVMSSHDPFLCQWKGIDRIVLLDRGKQVEQ
jgi:putative ABC transport system ATP-binding protein